MNESNQRGSQRASRTSVTLHFLLGASFVFSAPATIAQQRFEHPATFRASQFVAPNLLSGANFRVDDHVTNDGYLNIFTIYSNYGEMRAVSDAMLEKRVGEIKAIAQLKQISRSDAFKKGLKQASGRVLEGAKGAITDPIGTLTGAVSGVGALFRRAGQSMTESAKTDTEDSGFKRATGFSTIKRQYAFNLGVDVYSRNKALQKELDSVTQATQFGGLLVSVGMLAIPGGAGIALRMTKTSKALNEVFLNSTPTDLRARMRKQIAEMGINSGTGEMFLHNSMFTLREQVEIVEALFQIRGAKNRGAFLAFAAHTDNADVAFFRNRQAQMYLGYHLAVAQIREFVGVGSIAAAATRDGIIIFNVPLDYLVWTQDMAAIIGRANANVDAMPGIKGKELWLSGQLSALAREQLTNAGWKVVAKTGDRLLHDS